jgi:N-acetylmuramoyl-L-alanine amidase
MTRQDDSASNPNDRANQIGVLAPTLALSLHYNALPDAGDALNTAGVGAFWFHAQARDLAQFLHDYLVKHLDRPSYGVYWNNLALTRPQASPAVLLELGFMTNPGEFEWIQDPDAQQELAETLAAAITDWLHRTVTAPAEEKPR